jgi:transposase
MWTLENRPRYDRSRLRYPSDLTDEEWALIGSLIPPAKKGGNKRTVDVRAVVNGVMYILSTGCQWAALPKDLPPRSTVNDYLRRWDDDRTLDRIHQALYVQCRELAGREASPTVAIIDSQSVKSAEKGGGLSICAGMTRAKDQGQEASPPGRYAGPAAVCHHPCRRHSGSRWRCAVDEHAVRPVPVPAEALR